MDVSNDERVSSDDGVVSACVRWSSGLNFAPETATIVHTNVLKTFTVQRSHVGNIYLSATNLISKHHFTVIRLISRN